MNTYRWLKQVTLLIAMISVISTPVFADRDDRDWKKGGGEYNQRHYNQHAQKGGYGGTPYYKSNQPPPKGYKLDSRYHHNHYYPPAGYPITKLPPKSYNVYHGGARYYYGGGIWYRPYGGTYIVVRPPVGLYVPFLPAYYTTIWFGGIPYYYANNVYYVWDANRASYIVTNPPVNISTEQTPPVVTDELYVYPKQGQSEQQQANDRYACHSWSVKQTGFDPTQPPATMSQDLLNTKRLDYQRAMRACLEGRGYSVR